VCGAEVEYRFAGSRDHLLRVTFLTFRDVVERALRRDPVPEIHAECRAQFTRRDVIGSGEVWNGHPSRNTIHVAVPMTMMVTTMNVRRRRDDMRGRGSSATEYLVSSGCRRSGILQRVTSPPGRARLIVFLSDYSMTRKYGVLRGVGRAVSDEQRRYRRLVRCL